MESETTKLTPREKNEFIFNRLFFEPNFNYEINKIFDKWKLPIKKEFNSFRECVEEFQRSHKNKSDFLDFLGEIELLIQKFNLANNWKSFFTIYFLTLIKVFPNESFYVDVEKAKYDKRLIIELTPYTTLEDIRINYPKIEALKKKLWPNIKNRRITKKTVDNWNIYIKDIKRRCERKAYGKFKFDDFFKDAKVKLSQKQKEDILFEWFSADFAKDLIYEYVNEEKMKFNDDKIADEIWPLKNGSNNISIKAINEADKRHRNSLRKIRYRQKKKDNQK